MGPLGFALVIEEAQNHEWQDFMVVGLKNEGRATIPGTVKPHDSGFIATCRPSIAVHMPGQRLRIFANVITAVGG